MPYTINDEPVNPDSPQSIVLALAKAGVPNPTSDMLTATRTILKRLGHIEVRPETLPPKPDVAMETLGGLDQTDGEVIVQPSTTPTRAGLIAFRELLTKATDAAERRRLIVDLDSPEDRQRLAEATERLKNLPPLGPPVVEALKGPIGPPAGFFQEVELPSVEEQAKQAWWWSRPMMWAPDQWPTRSYSRPSIELLDTGPSKPE